MTDTRRETLALCATTASALVLTFWPNLLLGQVLFCRDMGRMHFPVKTFLRHQLAQGHFPLWYPYDGLGVPFIAASHTSVFHPLTLLEVALPSDVGLTLAALCTVVVAVVATWRLARRFGTSLSGAALASLVFGVGGPFVSNVGNITYLWGAAGFPLFLLGLDGAVRGPRRRRGLALAGLAVALAILAGDVEAAYLYGLVGLPYALWRREGPALGALWRTAAAGALGLAVAAVQILPSLAILPVLDRAVGLPWTIAADWSLNRVRLPGLFFGDLIRLQAILEPVRASNLLGFGGKPPWLLGAYLGPLPLLGLAWLLASRGDRRLRRLALGLAGAAGVLLWLALGKQGGLYRVLFDVLPLWNRWRYPQKLVPFAAVALALLAGLGLTRAFAHPGRATRVALVFGAVLLALAGIGALAPSLPSHLAAALASPDAVPASVPPAAAIYASRLVGGLARGGLLMLAAAGLLVVARQRGRLQALAPVLLVGLALADLATQSSRVVTLCSANRWTLYTPSTFAEVLAKEAGPSLGRYRLTPALGKVAIDLEGPGLGASSGAAASFIGSMLWSRQTLEPDYGGLDRVETTLPYLPAVTARLLHVLHPDTRKWVTTYGPLFNSRYLVIRPEDLARSELAVTTVSLARRFDLALTRQNGTLPRAFVARPRFIHGEAAARAALDDPEVQAGRVAAVEAPDPGGPWPVRHALVAAPVEADRPGRVVVRTPEGPAGVLVLNDAWFPGWRVRVDGRPGRVVQANDLVRGVLLPAGAHRVVFTYPLPVSLAVGGAVSIVALGLLAGLWWTDRRRRETSPAAESVTKSVSG